VKKNGKEMGEGKTPGSEQTSDKKKDGKKLVICHIQRKG